MSNDILYSEDHEYVIVDGDIATVGISDHAQEQLGDIVYVELPEVGQHFEKGEETGVVESVKVASEVYAPISGEVVEVNEALESNAGLVNADPVGDGWFFKLKIEVEDELSDLKDEADYQEFLETLG